MPDTRKVAIIGGGIAGLCAAVYAQKSGYQTEILEMSDNPGGLATSWHRGAYTFETCLHWLLGSNPDSAMYSQWREVFDIGRLTFVHPQEYTTLETEHGERLVVYTNPDRMETELLQRAPEDAAEIHHLASAIRSFAKIALPDPAGHGPHNWLALLRTLPDLPMLRWWSKLSIEEYGNRFRNPLLRAFFQSGDSAQLSAIALVFSLAWMSDLNGGYPIGGSQAIIRLIVENFRSLGGRLRLGAKVDRIVVESDAATGVRLADGETIAADWVISAADGHATIYDLLGGKYADKLTDKIYRTLKTFPSYLQVSLGVARDLSQQPGYLTRLLDVPLRVDPGTQLSRLPFRFFHFDPTFAPPGKTAVTCFLPTCNFDFWVDLQQHNPARYQAEKDRIAEAVVAVLEKMVPGVRQAIEVVDVSTPATVIRCTGNWKGSMEGWLLTPGSGFRPLRMTLPGLRQFLMVGQWVMPGGGLPSGLMTARSAIQTLCKQDRVPFLPQQAVAAGFH
ncbi:MAG: NAD(P)/FAD-dependent oxidoreductase [Bryobacteraceae bacterium]|jgi:phytoene dehydrogenase-like protein